MRADMVVNRPAVEAGLALLEAGGDLPTASLPKKDLARRGDFGDFDVFRPEKLMQADGQCARLLSPRRIDLTDDVQFQGRGCGSGGRRVTHTKAHSSTAAATMSTAT